MEQDLREMLKSTGIVVSEEEWRNLEEADFGLGWFAKEGAYMISLASTSRVALKVLILLPGQALPEHRHVSPDNREAKEEFLRPFSGALYLYTPGEGTGSCRIPPGKENWYTCRAETKLLPGMQAYVAPGTRHWFAAGEEGCVLLSFSSEARDQTDQFTDPHVVRKPTSSALKK